LGRGASKDFPSVPSFGAQSVRTNRTSAYGADLVDDMSEVSDEAAEDDKILWHIRRSSVFSILSDKTKRQFVRRLRELLTTLPPSTPNYDRGMAHKDLADECHKFHRGGHAKMTTVAYADLMKAPKTENKTIPMNAKIVIFDYSINAYAKTPTCSGLSDMRAYAVNIMLWSVADDPEFNGRDPFDPTCPRLHALDGRDVDNADKFNTAAIKSGIVFFFQFGSFHNQKTNVGNFSAILLDVLGTQPDDKEHLDAVLGDAFVAARAACFLSGGAHAANGSLDDLTAVKDANSKSPLFCFASAIKESQAWTDEAERLGRFCVPNKLHTPELNRIRAALPLALTLDGCPALLVSAKRLVELRALIEPSLVEAVEAMLLKLLVTSVAAVSAELTDTATHCAANLSACLTVFEMSEGLPGDTDALKIVVNKCKSTLAENADVVKVDAVVAAATIKDDEPITCPMVDSFAKASTAANGLTALLLRNPSMAKTIATLAARIVSELTLASFSSKLFPKLQEFLDATMRWMSAESVTALFKPYGGATHLSSAYVLAHELATKLAWFRDASQLENGTFSNDKCKKIQMAALSAWASQRVAFNDALSKCSGLDSLPIAALKTEADHFTDGMVRLIVELSAAVVADSLKTAKLDLAQVRRGPPPGDLWSAGLSADVPLEEWKELAETKLIGKLDYDDLDAALRPSWAKLAHADKVVATFPGTAAAPTIDSIDASRNLLRDCTITWAELHVAHGLANQALLRNPASTMRYFKKAADELRTRGLYDSVLVCLRGAFENAAKRSKLL
jgi:hypothetical protein